jgi:hypothetical protein
MYSLSSLREAETEISDLIYFYQCYLTIRLKRFLLFNLIVFKSMLNE